jgi:hypothetical protein
MIIFMVGYHSFDKQYFLYFFAEAEGKIHAL